MGVVCGAGEALLVCGVFQGSLLSKRSPCTPVSLFCGEMRASDGPWVSWEEGPLPRKGSPVVPSGLFGREGRERQ